MNYQELEEWRAKHHLPSIGNGFIPYKKWVSDKSIAELEELCNDLMAQIARNRLLGKEDSLGVWQHAVMTNEINRRRNRHAPESPRSSKGCCRTR